MSKEKGNEISRMFQFAGNYKYFTILACVLSGISTILSMVPLVCIWFVIRDIIISIQGGDITQATNSSFYAWIAFIFSVLSIIIYFLALICSHLSAYRIAKNMRKQAIHHIVKLPLGYFNQNASGKIRKIIDDNAGLTEGFMAHQLPDLTGAIIMPIAILVVLLAFNWKMGICCLIPLIISVFFLKQMMGGDNAEFMGKYMKALESMNKEAVEYMRGIPVVKVFQQTIYSFKNFHAAIEEYKNFATNYSITCRIPLTGFNVSLNSTFILLVPLVFFILNGVSGQASYTKVVLDFLFYSIFTPICTTMMNRIMFASDQLMAAKSAINRIDEVFSEKPLVENTNTIKPENNSIEFKNVVFSYPKSSEKALDNVSFSIEEGQTVALVGASGSGKSTAASLVPRFFDVQEGSISIGNVDVRNIAKKDLMSMVSFVFQNTKLFKDTLLNNISMSKPNATREEINTAIEATQCEEIVSRLPDGLETKVGTGGTYLSGGEAQRISLARAVLKDAPIVILDEVTAFADAENEHKIQSAFESLLKGKTVMMIAHRLPTIKNADKILVFKDGKIVESGTHEELINKNGIYNSMWNDYQTSISWKVGVKND